MIERAWQDEGSEDPQGEGRSARPLEITGAWYELSRARLGWTFDGWYDAAVSAVARELAAGKVDDVSLAALGASRAARGASESETLTDLVHGLEAAGPPATVDPLRARAALTVGHRRQSPGESWFGDVGAFAEAVREGIQTPGGGADARTVIVVDVDLTWLGGPERGIALATAAERLHREFPFAGAVAALGECRFAVVVHRHPGLAVGSEALQMWLESEPLLAGSASVWLVAPPARPGEVSRFVRDLTRSRPLSRMAAYEPRVAASGGAGAELLLATAQTAPVRPHRRLHLVTASLDGVGMVGAALAALLLAIGLGRVVGPARGSSGPAGSPFAIGMPAAGPDGDAGPRAFAMPPPEPPFGAEEVALVEELPAPAPRAATSVSPDTTPGTLALPTVNPVSETAGAPSAPEPPPVTSSGGQKIGGGGGKARGGGTGAGTGASTGGGGGKAHGASTGGGGSGNVGGRSGGGDASAPKPQAQSKPDVQTESQDKGAKRDHPEHPDHPDREPRNDKKAARLT